MIMEKRFLLGQAWSLPFLQGSGGARRDRTDDLLNANQALSQLSYGPSQAADPAVTAVQRCQYQS